MCMSGLHAFVYKYHVCCWCPRKPAEGILFSRTRVMGDLSAKN